VKYFDLPVEYRAAQQSQKVIAQPDFVPSAHLLRAFPNPTVGNLAVEIFVNDAEKYQIILSDITGREILVSAQNLPVGINQLTLDMSGLKNGLYFLSVRKGNASRAVKNHILRIVKINE
jgi:hypothetical protein